MIIKKLVGNDGVWGFDINIPLPGLGSHTPLLFRTGLTRKGDFLIWNFDDV